MQDLQLMVKTQNGVISTNFEEIKLKLTDALEMYRGVQYSDDTIKTAREDVATLRKLAKAVDTKRKEVKRNFMDPYDEFELKTKELVEIINDTITPIEKQISDYSEKVRQEKKANIEKYFNEVLTEDVAFLKFEDVFKTKWISNMSTSMKSIKTEIDVEIEKVKNDMDAIRGTGSDAIDKALSEYRATKDLAHAMQLINQYERNKAEILAREEARKKAEEQRRQEEIRRREEEQKRKEEQRIREEQKTLEEQRHKEELERFEEEARQTYLEEDPEETFFADSIDSENGFNVGFEQEDVAEGFNQSDSDGFITPPETIICKYSVSGTEEFHARLQKYLKEQNVGFSVETVF